MQTNPMNPNFTLHQVYLRWLIENDPPEFLKENDIRINEIWSFRGDNFTTWRVWIS